MERFSLGKDFLMKKLLSLLFFLPLLAFGQLPPLVHNQFTTNQSAVLPVPASLLTNSAEILIFPNTNFYYNGQWFYPSGSATAGLQEAINTLPLAANTNSWGGGAIRMAPGIYYTYTNLTLYNQSNPFTLKINGAGIGNCGITYVGSTTQEVVTIGNPNSGSCINLELKDMWIASTINTTNSMVHLLGYELQNSGRGSFANVNIDHVWFGLWTGMTNSGNNYYGGFSPSVGYEAPGLTHPLIPLNIELNLNEKCIIQNCAFTYVNGASICADHCAILNNEFEFCGINNGNVSTNGWNTNSWYSIGAACYLIDPSNNTVANGNEAYDIWGNYFVNCRACYYAAAFQGSIADAFVSYEDVLENCPAGVVVDTPTMLWADYLQYRPCSWTFVNPKYPYYSYGTQNYINTNRNFALAYTCNVTNYTGTNLVKVLDARTGVYTGNVSYTGTFTSTNGAGYSGLMQVQTNSGHGVFLQFTNGLFIGNSVY
jgi:hypothetical protein